MSGSSLPPDGVGGRGADHGPRPTGRSVFRRGELPLAHAVYGLILTLATVGELIHREGSATASVSWLLGGSAVLLGAHVFSDLLAHIAAARDDPNWSEIVSIGHEDIAVVYGGIGAAMIMVVAAIFDLDSENALIASVGVGLVALAALCYYGLSHQRPLIRLVVSAASVGFAIVIVGLENTF